MNLRFQNICPNALADVEHSKNSVWKNDVTLEKSNCVFLSARSGRGKSTLIGILNGIRHDFSGDCFIDNQNSRDISAEEWAGIRQRKIATVYQDLKLFPELTVRENIEIKNQLTHFKTEKEWVELLQKLEIEFKIEQKCGELSIGQQQRVAIVRALCQPFKWLLLDEPFSHLDDTTMQLASEVITAEANQQDAGVLLTSLGSDYLMNFDTKIVL